MFAAQSTSSNRKGTLHAVRNFEQQAFGTRGYPVGTGPGHSAAGRAGGSPLWGSNQGGPLCVPPHTLSKAGLFTVISGTFRIGMGETVNPSKATAMPAGSFVALPPGTPHFVSVDEETIVQLNNIGPWEITYIDAREDPRRQSK
jgi:hypothetical protein